MNRHVNAIAGRLSLRPPQRRSLEILDRITEIAPPGKGADTVTALAAIRSEFPSVTDFEREFPSLCFALATGVGKTRLMGAFISYLHLAHGIDNFFMLAPILTIRESDNPIVKPFLLVIARDITHAGQLMTRVRSDDFFDGRYKDKVIQVDSSKTGAEEEEMIARLLKVEHTEEPTEIVIHVNMPKEGWDVTNLYTIVPLRAANALVGDDVQTIHGGYPTRTPNGSSQ